MLDMRELGQTESDGGRGYLQLISCGKPDAAGNWLLAAKYLKLKQKTMIKKKGE